MIKRTQEEIVARMAEVSKKNAMFDFESRDLIEFLDWEHAKPHLVAEATEAQWNERNITPPLDQAKEYLVFAWDKANDERGLSAMRSVQHLRAWLWLAGYPADIFDDIDDANYGKARLVLASELVGFDWRTVARGYDNAHAIWKAGRLKQTPGLTMREALTKAAEQFEFYAKEHRFRDKPEKAQTNERMAKMCRDALERPDPLEAKIKELENMDRETR